jgi:hypothetical protein
MGCAVGFRDGILAHGISLTDHATEKIEKSIYGTVFAGLG